MPTAKKRKAASVPVMANPFKEAPGAPSTSAPEPAAPSWAAECRAAIASSDGKTIPAIMETIAELAEAAKARAQDLKPKPRTVDGWVKMIASSEEHDQDFDCNMNSRAIEATFEVGPTGYEFYINFSCENAEGELTVNIESQLFIYRKSDVYNTFGPVSDETIEAELRTMGLLDDSGLPVVQPTNEYASEYEEASTDAARRRWLYAMVIDRAIGWVEDEYGRYSKLNVELPMFTEDIYYHLEVERS